MHLFLATIYHLLVAGFMNMTKSSVSFPVTTSQFCRTPLGCSWTGDSQHESAPKKKSVNMDQNLKWMFPGSCGVHERRIEAVLRARWILPSIGIVSSAWWMLLDIGTESVSHIKYQPWKFRCLWLYADIFVAMNEEAKYKSQYATAITKLVKTELYKHSL